MISGVPTRKDMLIATSCPGIQLLAFFLQTLLDVPELIVVGKAGHDCPQEGHK